jgi:3-isopropylmalate dehydrogenase
MNKTIVILPGDGIGPEVVSAAQKVLEAVERKGKHSFHFLVSDIGGASIDRSGVPLTPETLADCRAADAVLLGAVGGPKWDNPNGTVRPEQGLLALRKGLNVFANLRPVKVYPSLTAFSPLKPENLTGVDILVVRELTGGLYFGKPSGREEIGGHTRVVDTLEYQDFEIQRIIRLGFEMAAARRGKLTSVDKANVLSSSRLWRQTADEIHQEFPQVKLEHMLVDTAAMQIVANPAQFDVLVTENMFGDILTDEAAVLAGSMGLLPSASLGQGGPGLYEPIHGSAPGIAGKGIANPIGTILSAALLLRYSLGMPQEALWIEAAVEEVIAQGSLTVDLGGNAGTSQVTERILDHINQ